MAPALIAAQQRRAPSLQRVAIARQHEAGQLAQAGLATRSQKERPAHERNPCRATQVLQQYECFVVYRLGLWSGGVFFPMPAA